MITIIISVCVVISVAVICYTYYKIEELKQCLISNDIDTVNTLETIERLIDKYSKSINDKTINPSGFIDVNSINTFNDSIRVIINNEIEYEQD
jgi:hypothetical protein